MNKLHVSIVSSLFCLLAAIPIVLAAESPVYRSPYDLAYSPDGKVLAVSDRTAGAAVLIDPVQKKVVRQVKLNGRPMGVAWSGGKLYVAEYDAGSVAEIAAESGKVLRRLPAGPKAVGVAVAAQKNLLLVTDYGLHTVIAVDLATGKEAKRIPAVYAPMFLAVTPDESLAVVANSIPFGDATQTTQSCAVTVIDLAKMEKVADISLPSGCVNLREIAVSADGKWAYVVHTVGRFTLPTTQLERGWINSNGLTILDLSNRTCYATVLLDQISSGAADPWGLALSPDGTNAWISLAGTHEVAHLNLAGLQALLPRGLAVASGGAQVAVAIPMFTALAGAADLPSWPAEWQVFGPIPKTDSTVLDEKTLAAIPKSITFGGKNMEPEKVKAANGRIDFKELFSMGADAKVGAWMFAELESPADMTIEAGAGADWWMEWYVNGKKVCDTLDDGNQIGALTTYDHRFKITLFKGKNVIAAHILSGSGGFLIVGGGLKAFPSEEAKRQALAYDLAALHAGNVLHRTALPGKGPRGLAVAPDGAQVAVAMYFSGQIVFLDTKGTTATVAIPVGPQPEADAVRRGETAFYSAEHCFQGWVSCATCHPDTRADGLNWDLLNDGIGNPKNTKSMVWATKTPPAMSLGVRESAEVAVEKGFQFIQFSVAGTQTLADVRAYLQNLEPERSPYPVAGKLSPKAAKGKKVFESDKAACAKCHPAPLFTDLKTYDVGTAGALDREQKQFDTPTLIELWRTAPFLHDGSAPTLLDLLTTRNKGEAHGKTSTLSKEDLDALVEYLLSL